MFVWRWLPLLCALALASGSARAGEPEAAAAAPAAKPAPAAVPAAPAVHAAPAVPAESAPEEAPSATPHAPPPSTAFAALVRAAAAYEYGDMSQVVDAVRPVAEGSLPANPSQRTRALRFLGIGLYLTNRAFGAENAFSELLRIDPDARLDPTTTRPEVVAFFENIRHQQVKREMSSRSFLWNLFPPAGQFQNGQKTKAWILGGIELGTAVAAATSYLLVTSWHHPKDDTYDHDTLARPLQVANVVSLGLLIATYAYGVVDGLVNYYKTPDEAATSLTWKISPDGSLRLTF
jgi:hypothetical protein